MALCSRAVAAALVLGWSASAFAQDVVGLRQAVQDALAHNRALQAGDTRVREADAGVNQARSAYYPRISLAESWQRSNQPVFVFSSLLSSRQFAASNFAIDALNHPDPTGFFRAQIAFEQIVFDGGRTSVSVDGAALQRDLAAFAADGESAAVAAAVIAAYGRTLAAQMSSQAAAAAIVAAEEDATRATLRRDAGALNDADVLAMAAHLAAARQRQAQVDGEALLARAELNRLMGSPIDRRLDVEDPLFSETAIRELAPLAALFAEADLRRPDLKRAAAGERLADNGRRSARSTWSPQLAAQGGFESAGTTVFDRATSWAVGAELRWTFSTGGAQFAARRAAAEAVSRARLEREDARAAAQVEIVGALQRLNTALAQREAVRANAAFASEQRRVVRDRFEAGLASTADLLRAETLVAEAEAARASSVSDAFVARAQLDRSVGRPPLSITRLSP